MSALRPPRTRAFATFAALLICSAVALGLAQQVVFRAGVEVVVIDVNVVQSGSWVPLGDLKAGDFTVTVDGKPRTVSSVVYVSQGAAGSGQISADRMGGVDLPAAMRVNDIGRHILIAVDEDSLTTGDVMVARRAAKSVLSMFGPAERIGVATIPRLPAALTFTTDRAAISKAIDNIGKAAGQSLSGVSHYSIGLSEAFEMERGQDREKVQEVLDRNCGQLKDESARMACETEVRMEAHSMVLEARVDAQRSLDTLRAIGEAMREIEGPKVLIFVSGGLGIPENASAFTDVEAQLAPAQATLYTLYIEKPQIPNLARPVSPTFFDDHQMEQHGVENVTSAVGGTFIHVVGQVEAAFERVAREISGTYLLGIEVVPEERDGTPHFVDVKVNRPNVAVRARKRYVIPAERPRAAGTELPAAFPRPNPEAARAPRPPVSVPLMTPELKALLGRAGEYVTTCEIEFGALLFDEAYEETLSKLKLTSAGGVSDWTVEKRRRMRSDYLLAHVSGLAGWLPYRDTYEVDGKQVRKPDGRLARLFVDTPAKAFDRAKQLSEASTRYNLGFIDRNVNLPTAALLFLKHLNRERFAFVKEGEETIEGMPTWKIAFIERDSPTFVQGEYGDLPAEGAVWLDPVQGRVVKTFLRLKEEPIETEITVIYRPDKAFGALWLPAEMRESYTAPAIKVECTARYTNPRLVGRQ